MLLENNPGLAGLQLYIGYDSSVLTLESRTSITDGTEFKYLMFSVPNDSTYLDNPFTVTGASCFNDYTSGILLNIQFKVSQTAVFRVMLCKLQQNQK